MNEPTPKFKIGDLVLWPNTGSLERNREIWRIATITPRARQSLSVRWCYEFQYGLVRIDRPLGQPTEHIYEWGLQEVEPVVAEIIKARNEHAKV